MTPLLAYRLRRDFDGSFETVYKNHVRDVYGFALSLLGNADDAEDVTQTTFLNAYRALERGEQVRNVRAWLLAIAHNVCRQRFRTAARRPQEVQLDPEAAEAFRDEDAPSAQDIRAAMAQLSFNQRTVLVLREIEGLSYEEISRAMDISLSAVETLLFRARQALREQLDAADNDLGCDSVQRLISLQLDGKLSRQDKGLLRAHLRSCAECARFARSQRARKRVMPSLLAVPLPLGLTGGFSVGGAGVGTSFGAGLASAKVAALAVSAVLIGAGAGNMQVTEAVTIDGTTQPGYAGRPLVVNFFASYCVPCEREMPALQAVADELGDRVAVVGMNLADEEDAARALVEQTGVTYDLGRDPDAELAQALGVVNLPTTVFATADHRVVEVHTGALDEDQLREKMHALLQAA